MRALPIIAALLLLASPLLAQSAAPSAYALNSGNDMMTAFGACDRSLTAYSVQDEAVCIHLNGYIDGASDVAIAICAAEKSCEFHVPSEVTRGQIYDVVRKYLLDHPEDRQESAWGLVETAIAQAWPKPKTN